jgi:hypothetical protein
MPLLAELRGDLRCQIEGATDRIRGLEDLLQNKVDKEFVEVFFRKLRIAVQEAKEKVAVLQNALAERTARDEIEQKLCEASGGVAQSGGLLGVRGSPVNCLVCGGRKPAQAPGIVVTKRGGVFRGRAQIGPLAQPDWNDPQLPPLTIEE